MRIDWKKKAVILLGVLMLLGCEKSKIEAQRKQRFEISSTHTGFDYEINVLYPNNYVKGEPYQTVYLLDGGKYYKKAEKITNEMTNNNIVLVSIDYRGKDKRDTDFTYPKDQSFGGKTGKGDKFVQFFNSELIPHIENELGISSLEKTLYGHSYGGYFTMYYMFQQEQEVLFDNFISASIPLNFADNYLVKLEQEYFNAHDSLNCHWHISYGSIENQALFKGFMEKMNKRTYNGLEFMMETYENKGHNSTPMIAFENGLKFVLN